LHLKLVGENPTKLVCKHERERRAGEKDRQGERESGYERTEREYKGDRTKELKQGGKEWQRK
jgi:hypothetical protein